MNIKKVFMYILLLVSLVSVSHSALSDEQLYYLKLDGDLLDATSNGNDGTNGGTTNDNSGIINQGRDFVAANPDKITTPDFTGTTDYENETLNFWIKRDITVLKKNQ